MATLKVSKLIDEMADLAGFSKQHRKVAYAQRQAMRNYRPKGYPGQLTLFRARMQPLFSSHKPDKGWGRLRSRRAGYQNSSWQSPGHAARTARQNFSERA